MEAYRCLNFRSRTLSKQVKPSYIPECTSSTPGFKKRLVSLERPGRNSLFNGFTYTSLKTVYDRSALPSFKTSSRGNVIYDGPLQARWQIAGSVREKDLYAAKDDNVEVTELTFLERLVKAWSILFPPKPKPLTNAEIARERLRLVLYSDRGEVSPEVQQKLKDNILEAISKYVEVERDEEVRLNVSTDPDIGTVYAVIVPVRRVRPEYQETWFEGGFRRRVWTEENLNSNGIEFSNGQIYSKIRLETNVLEDMEMGEELFD